MKTTILLITFLISLVLLTFTLRGQYGNFNLNNSSELINTQLIGQFESSHERATFAETISLIETHSFKLNKNLAIFSSPDVGFYKGNFFSLFPPGVSLLILPLYLLGRLYGLAQVFSYFTISISAVLCLLLLYKISRSIFKLSISVSLFISMIFIFASSAWSYSITIYQHLPTTFLMLLAFYSCWKFKNNSRFGGIWIILSWFSIGISIFLDYPNILLMVPILIYLLFTVFNIKRVDGKRRIVVNLTMIFGSLFFCLAISLYLLFSYQVYGKLFQFTNTIARYDINALKVSNSSIQTNSTNLVNTNNITSIFKEDRLVEGFYLLTISPEKGIFIFSPIFILIFFAFFKLKSVMVSEKWLLIAIPLMNLWIYASFVDPWGGWAFGPRYLIPSMPFLAILVGIWVSSSGRKFLKKFLALVLFLVSSAIALMGALTTNLLPPKIEATYLKIPYGLSVNWNALISNQSSSFIYNYFFSSQIPLFEYYLIVYGIVVFTILLVMFIIPIVENHGN